MDQLLKPNRIFLYGGIILLVLGLSLPWVTMDPVNVREQRLAEVGSKIKADWPEEVLGVLDRLNVRPGMSTDDFWLIIGSDEFASNIEAINQLERVYAWQFFNLNTPATTKLVVTSIALTVIACLIAAAWGLLNSNSTAMPDWEQEDLYTSDDFSGQSRTMNSAYYAIPAGIVFLFFMSQMPGLDSLGHSGEWTMSWLDVITGARVGIAPRFLIPLGLISVMIAAILGNFFSYRDTDVYLID